MRRRLAMVAALLALTSACGLVGDDGDGDDESGLQVTVVKGIDLAPGVLKRAEEPAARYLQDSRVVVFVSAPLFSGSCPPEADAEMGEEGSIRLVLDGGASDRACTDDAMRYTFLVQGFRGDPTRLEVSGQGSEADLRLTTATGAH